MYHHFTNLIPIQNNILLVSFVLDREPFLYSIGSQSPGGTNVWVQKEELNSNCCKVWRDFDKKMKSSILGLGSITLSSFILLKKSHEYQQESFHSFFCLFRKTVFHKVVRSRRNAAPFHHPARQAFCNLKCYIKPPNERLRKKDELCSSFKWVEFWLGWLFLNLKLSYRVHLKTKLQIKTEPIQNSIQVLRLCLCQLVI